eukprot:TRINITY_DN12302_c0_g1_i2.p2 TRINITY_DN12302_c0_g1~~TRINITY_DN12302_c0_g1_i2.p2  ORF type:complete len:190 (-),score=13.43 TRINITY_DN12302_c0_g1_i2:524-1093(-)
MGWHTGVQRLCPFVLVDASKTMEEATIDLNTLAGGLAHACTYHLVWVGADASYRFGHDAAADHLDFIYAAVRSVNVKFLLEILVQRELYGRFKHPWTYPKTTSIVTWLTHFDFEADRRKFLRIQQTVPAYDAASPLKKPLNPSCCQVDRITSKLLELPCMFANCTRVLITQMGLVTVLVTMPAMSPAPR